MLWLINFLNVHKKKIVIINERYLCNLATGFFLKTNRLQNKNATPPTEV